MKKETVFNIIIFLIIFISVLSTIFTKSFGDLDELWNYNFARNVSDGLIPYKDFNMVQMPLLPFISAIFLKLVANEMIVMRILAGILCSGVLYSIYKILKELKVYRSINLLILFFIGYISKDLWCMDYNWATLFVVLNIIYIELKSLKNDKNNFLKPNLKTDILIGVLSGVCIGLKQTTGIAICIVALVHKLLWVKNKQELKIYFQIFKNRFKGVIVPIAILLLYFICTNAVPDFINYTILGIKNFDNYRPYTQLFDKEMLIKVLAIIVPTTIVYIGLRMITIIIRNFKKTIAKEVDFHLYIMLAYSLTMLIIIYPIADNIHFTIGIVTAIINFLYLIITVIKKIIAKISKKIKTKPRIIIRVVLQTMLDIAIFIIIVIIIKNSYYNLRQYTNERFSVKEHFHYIPLAEEFEDEITEVGNYILNNEKEGITTYILDSDAAVYMIPINRYTKDYDLFLKGNLGAKTEEDIIKELKEKENVIFLIKKANIALNWQTPRKVIDYLRINNNKVGEIFVFDIYEGEK